MSQTKAQLIEGNAASEITAAKTLLGAGSVGSPSLTVIGDTNTGIYFPAADTIGFVEGGVEAARIDSSGDFAFNSGYGSAATAYGCRAWVNFDGTTSGTNPAPMTIRASGNVSSVTRTAGGLFTISFITAMPDADYVVVGAGNRENNSNAPGTFGVPRDIASTTSEAFVCTGDASGDLRNNAKSFFMFIR